MKSDSDHFFRWYYRRLLNSKYITMSNLSTLTNGRRSAEQITGDLVPQPFGKR